MKKILLFTLSLFCFGLQVKGSLPGWIEDPLITAIQNVDLNTVKTLLAASGVVDDQDVTFAAVGKAFTAYTYPFKSLIPDLSPDSTSTYTTKEDCMSGGATICVQDTSETPTNKDSADDDNSNIIAIFQAVLDAGANPNVYDSHSCTPLRYVVQDRKSTEMATALLDKGAGDSINNVDSYFNKTVLDYAEDEGDDEMINLLLKYGAENA